MSLTIFLIQKWKICQKLVFPPKISVQTIDISGTENK